MRRELNRRPYALGALALALLAAFVLCLAPAAPAAPAPQAGLSQQAEAKAAPPAREGKSPVPSVIFLAIFVVIAVANWAVFRGGRRRWLKPPGRVEGEGFSAFGGGFGPFGGAGPKGVHEPPGRSG